MRAVLAALLALACAEAPSDMAAVAIHEDRPSRREIILYSGASAVSGEQSDPLLLSTDYQGSGVNLQNPQTYSKVSKRTGNEAASSWQTMRPTTVHSAEITLAYHLRHTWGIESTGILVYGAIGSGLNDDWINGVEPANWLANSLTRAQSELALLGEDYIVRAVVMQVAAADCNSGDAPLYRDNLDAFAAAHRAVWPDISMILSYPSAGLTGEGFGQEWVDMTRAAVEDYVASDSNSLGINVDAVPFSGTGPHYLTPEDEELGEIYAGGTARMIFLPRRGGVIWTP